MVGCGAIATRTHLPAFRAIEGVDVVVLPGGFSYGDYLRAGAIARFSPIMQEVAALCDRIGVIAKGRVVAQGTADELRAQTGEDNLEDAFVKAIGSEEGLHA